MQEVANELLRHALTRQTAGKRSRLVLRGWKAKEQQGVDLLDRDKLFDLLDRR